MTTDGCWSTIICTSSERAALGATSDQGWVLGCRLSIGHAGNHATDAESAPRHDRRMWLEWNDVDNHALSLIERNPCRADNPSAARCLLFEGHPGLHWFAPVNGHGHNDGPRRPRVDTLPRLTVPRTSILTQMPPLLDDAETQEPGPPATGLVPVTRESAGRHRHARHDDDNQVVGTGHAATTGNDVSDALDSVADALRQLASALRNR